MQKKLKVLSWVMVFCLTLICFSAADFTVSAATENANIISGESYRLQNVGSGKYLNVKSGSDSNGANINQFTGDNSITQDFIIRWIAAENCYKIYSACSDEGNNRVLDVSRGGQPITSGCNVQLWTETDPTSQRMQIVSTGTAGEYYIQPISNTSVYLTANGNDNGSSSTGASSTGNVVMKSAQSNSAYQKWKIIPKRDLPGDGFFYIRNKYSNKVMARDTANNIVLQESKADSAPQRWDFVPDGTGNYIIKQSGVDRYMYIYTEVDENEVMTRTARTRSGSTGAAKFKLISAGGRAYYIQSVDYPSTVLCLKSNTTADNAIIHLVTKNSYDRQKWYFEQGVLDSYGKMDWQYVFANPYTTPYRYLSSTFWEDNYHSGIDIIEYDGGIDGATILSPTSGIVAKRGHVEDGAGHYIVVRADDTDPITNKNLNIGFYHLKKEAEFAKDAVISTGNTLGYVGNSGDSTGSHLHLFITRNGDTSRDDNTVQSDLVNPELFFPNVEFYYHD